MLDKENDLESMMVADPFAKLTEGDLAYLLEHDKDKLTSEQIANIETKISQIKAEKEAFSKENSKVYTLTQPKKKAGYVDIVVLMLTTWCTCMVALAYIYANIMG